MSNMDDIQHMCQHNRISRNCYLCHMESIGRTQNPKTEFDALHEIMSELKIRVSKLEEYKRLQDDINIERASLINYKSYLALSDRLSELEDWTRKDEDLIHDKLKQLEEHRKKQIDENRAVVKHFDNLERSVCQARKEVGNLNSWIDSLGTDCGNDDESGQIVYIKNMIKAITELSRKSNAVEKRLTQLDEDNAVLNSRQNDIEFKYAVVPGNIENMVKLNFDNIDERIKRLEKLADSDFESPTELDDPKTTRLTFEEAISAFKSGKKIRRRTFGDFYTSIERASEGVVLYDLRIIDIMTNDWEIVL